MQNRELHNQLSQTNKSNEIKEKDRAFQKIRSLESQVKTVKEEADK